MHDSGSRLFIYIFPQKVGVALDVDGTPAVTYDVWISMVEMNKSKMIKKLRR